MGDGIGWAEALLGLDGFRVLEVSEGDSEVVIRVETTAGFVGCSTCGVRAEAQDRMIVEIRDLACFGRPARLVWSKRRWRCHDVDCLTRTWTETSGHISARCVLTRRAGAEACRWVGADARPVAGVARELGVCWWTVMAAVIEHGEPLVEDPVHVVRTANRALGKVRRRVQNDTLGHRGRKADPLYRTRKLLLSGFERLDQKGNDRMLLGLRFGDPHDEVLGAWLADRKGYAISTRSGVPPTSPGAGSTRSSTTAGPARAPRSAGWPAPSNSGANRSSPGTPPAPSKDSTR